MLLLHQMLCSSVLCWDFSLSWYNKFIPNFASVVMPLRTCLKDESGFHWSEEAQQSLADVKKLLIHSPALALFDPGLPVIISTDAFSYGLGAVFSQVGCWWSTYCRFRIQNTHSSWTKILYCWERSTGMCLGSGEMVNVLVGSQIYATDRSSSLDYAADYKRDW